jgi:lantibiotic modifying enzyme
VTGREDASALARAALSTMQRSTAERALSLTGIGAFDGWGGVIYVLSHLATLWRQADLASQADELAARLPALIENDDDFSLYGGAAGCILALRSLRCCLPSSRLTTTAIQCGDHLLRAAQRTADGLGWPGMSEGPTRRSGLAFGAAGIAVALFELHAWTGAERFRAAAVDAIEGERRRSGDLRPLVHVDPRESDREQAAHGGASWAAWCIGTGACDLSQLAVSTDTIRDPRAVPDIAAVAEAVRDRGFGRNHSLCHGDFGSLELLGRAAATLGDERVTREVEQMAAAILDEIEQHGYRCGTPLGVETPGWLAGLAGIGYGLLHAARPDAVPSVLTLEPPLPLRRADGG